MLSHIRPWDISDSQFCFVVRAETSSSADSSFLRCPSQFTQLSENWILGLKADPVDV